MSKKNKQNITLIGVDIEGKKADLLEFLAESVPSGSSSNSALSERVADNGIWKQDPIGKFWNNKLKNKLLRQFGSLGGGNHFLEIQEDQNGQIWAMIHSGSRFLGVIVRDYYIEEGKVNSDNLEQYNKIPYLHADSELGQAYLHDLNFAVSFARESRKEMMIRVIEAFKKIFPEIDGEKLRNKIIDSTHNFISQEKHFGLDLFIHRKGAIKVEPDETAMIPGSMGSNSYIVMGKDTPFSFHSCSHGAGRAMSRGDAHRTISDKQFKDSMKSITYKHDKRLKDESPAAYKDIHHVMKSQKDLIKIQYELKPVISLKGIK
jgi:tRNA-splicing ligase RtcB